MSSIICALDVSDLGVAVSIASALRGKVAMVKVGLEFFSAFGLLGVEKICEIGVPVFLDLKLHDIPRTIQRTVSILRSLPIEMLTVHISGGLDMMSAALAALSGSNIQLIGVTVLTSLDGGDLKSVGVFDSVTDQVVKLAKLAKCANLSGVVCSAHEAKVIRQLCGDNFTLVVPGIRVGGSSDDQKRVNSPKSAIDQGANYLVIGRPITQAQNPVAAVDKILELLS